MKTFFDKRQQAHAPLTYLSRGQMRIPQEVPERASRILEAVVALGFEICQPTDTGMQHINAVHSIDYTNFLADCHSEWVVHQDWGPEVISNIFVREPNALRGVLAKAARYLADGSCPVGRYTYEAAYWSAQSAVAAAEAIVTGEHQAYALCRPPGHHARADAAGGFCYLNNAAIAAERMMSTFSRVAILDTDMHHGQGIQEIFYSRSDVLYVSIHADPTDFYPVVAGFDDEHGEGEGEGYNINLPMAHHSSEAAFFERLEEALTDVTAFGADAIVLALGFDIYELDPQTLVAVTTEGFSRLGKRVGDLGLPTVIVQEGGYHLESLKDNTTAFFTGFNLSRLSKAMESR